MIRDYAEEWRVATIWSSYLKESTVLRNSPFIRAKELAFVVWFDRRLLCSLSHCSKPVSKAVYSTT